MLLHVSTKLSNWINNLDEYVIRDDLIQIVSSNMQEQRGELGGPAKRGNAAGWLVSHCNTCSDREYYAHELNKHYPVVARYR